MNKACYLCPQKTHKAHILLVWKAKPLRIKYGFSFLSEIKYVRYIDTAVFIALSKWK